MTVQEGVHMINEVNARLLTGMGTRKKTDGRFGRKWRRFSHRISDIRIQSSPIVCGGRGIAS